MPSCRSLASILGAEQNGETGEREARKQVLVAHGMPQSTQDHEREQSDQYQAEHHAELLGRDREHEVRVTFRQNALDRTFPRTAPEPAAPLK